MSHTEQMREALRKIKHEAVSLADAQVIALDALTAPAAEVPEAMGDAEIDKLLSTSIPGGSQARDWFLPHDTEKGLANVRDVVRLMLAQWQSTRLRGGVPEPEPVAVIGSGWQFLWASGDSLESIAKRHSLKIGSKLYTAAPQAPAAALDAVVVRDACKLRYTPDWKAGADGLPYQASNFACKTCGYVGKHDTHPGCKIAAMSTQAGKGGTE